MPFTKQEIRIIHSIFCHLAPGTIESIQTYKIEQKNRLKVIFGIKDNRNQYVYLFQYFENLSKARIKILEKRKKEVPYPINIIKSTEEIICIGWKTM